ncbi:replication protein [Paraburkholderia strydomiana]|jgi:phage replication O-like protein O|uniref:replication protein n=1 Tax=Paraburkholderia strydomiana TaxID=1245417 RepID=UPI0038BA5543
MSASPQVEDGHIKIANELYDAVLNYPFTARQLKVLLAIVRKTYGFNKKRDDVSASQISACVPDVLRHQAVLV